MKQPSSIDPTTIASTSYATRKHNHNCNQDIGRHANDLTPRHRLHQHRNSCNYERSVGRANGRPPPLSSIYGGLPSDSCQNIDVDGYSHEVTPTQVIGGSCGEGGAPIRLPSAAAAAGCANCVESAARHRACACTGDATSSPTAALLPADTESATTAVALPHSQQSTVSASGVRFANSRDYFSAFQQQQQFAFFPNASEKVMASTRRIIVLSIYVSSLVLSILLFLLAAIYCQVTSCSIVWAEKNRQYAQLFPICASCLIAFLSTCWLIANFRRVETSCMRDYSFLEMPSAVFSALLAGVCAVIEIHYNFDYSYLYWSEKWALAAADSVILVFLHAGLAFALT